MFKFDFLLSMKQFFFFSVLKKRRLHKKGSNYMILKYVQIFLCTSNKKDLFKACPKILYDSIMSLLAQTCNCCATY